MSQRPSKVGTRVVTGVVAGVVVLLLVFLVPPDLALPVYGAAFLMAAVEFVRIVRHFAPSAPLGSLLLWLPVALGVGVLWLRQGWSGQPFLALAAGFVPVALAAATTLLARGRDMRDAALSIGLLSFALPYFAAPVLCIYWLHGVDPWLLFLLLASVAFGDSAAFFAGRAFGRHKMAPAVSPGKTWEGAAGGFLASLATAALWGLLYLDRLPVGLLAVTAASAVIAQAGDLVESAFKRGAGVKDSSHLLPGHGGFYDRVDALLLAAPAFTLGVALIGVDRLAP